MKNIEVNLVNATHRNCYTEHVYEVISDQLLDEQDRKDLIKQGQFMIGQVTGEFNWNFKIIDNKYHYSVYSSCDSSD